MEQKKRFKHSLQWLISMIHTCTLDLFLHIDSLLASSGDISLYTEMQKLEDHHYIPHFPSLHRHSPPFTIQTRKYTNFSQRNGQLPNNKLLQKTNTNHTDLGSLLALLHLIISNQYYLKEALLLLLTLSRVSNLLNQVYLSFSTYYETLGCWGTLHQSNQKIYYDPLHWFLWLNSSRVWTYLSQKISLHVSVSPRVYRIVYHAMHNMP